MEALVSHLFVCPVYQIFQLVNLVDQNEHTKSAIFTGLVYKLINFIKKSKSYECAFGKLARRV